MILGVKLGEGTFGGVYHVHDPQKSGPRAFKRNFAETNTTYMSAIREVDILNKLRNHPHIVNLEGVVIGCPFTNAQFSPIVGADRADQRDDQIHFEFAMATSDLHQHIYRNRVPDFARLKGYMVDILLGLEYIHGRQIIHRDIKPSNILIFENDPNALGQPGVAKICDFGLSKPYTHQGIQTPSTSTSVYRAPEIALGCPYYDYKSDLWSIGCLFYEMIASKTFIPGNLLDNDKIISAILGALPMELPAAQFRDLVRNNRWRTITLGATHNPKVRRSFFHRFGMTKAGLKIFEEKVGSLDLCTNLLDQLLQFDPRLRLDATAALNHPFFAEYGPLIAATRSLYRPVPMPDQKLKVRECVERRWMAACATHIFNTRATLKWYTNRILFQAIDLFDRYLSVMFHYNQIRPNAVESELRGLVHDQFETELRFHACVYICVKYFSSLHYPIPFIEVAPEAYRTDEALAIVEQFEGGLIINCLEYDVYRGTVYEAADLFNDQLDATDLRDLIILSSRNSTLSDWTPVQIYTYYRNHLRGKDLSVLLDPFPEPPASSEPPTLSVHVGSKIPPPPPKPQSSSSEPPKVSNFKIPPPPPKHSQ